MRIDALRLFILSAKHLNITQAARDFHISQSAASRQLRQLQSDLGVKLLRKNGRGIELTKVGKSVLSDVLPIFSQLEALQKKYLKSKESLAVACNHDLSTHFMPSVMTAFSERHPTAQLTLHVGNSAEIEDLLLATRVEVAIITNLSASLSSILTLEPFGREPLVAFVMANHPLARKALTQSAQRNEYRFVIRVSRDVQSKTEMELQRLAYTGVKFKIAMRCEAAEAVKEAVRGGAGVGILYQSLIKRELDHGEFKLIKFPEFAATGQRYIVYSKEKPLSALAREFLSLLRASVMQNPPIKATPQPVPHRHANGHGRDHILRSKLLY